MNLISNGVYEGLNINIGESGTYIAPIFEGYCLPHAIIRYDIGRQDLTEYMMKLLSETAQRFSNFGVKILLKILKNKHVIFLPGLGNSLIK
jgi:actin beta/gamma 1